MKVIYIAGRYRDLQGRPWFIKQNIQRAELAASEVWKLGCVAFCPHMNSALFDGVAPDRVFLQGGLEMILRCDALYVFDTQWAFSSGTKAEVEFARKNGKPVHFTLQAVKDWLVVESGDQLTFAPPSTEVGNP